MTRPLRTRFIVRRSFTTRPPKMRLIMRRFFAVKSLITSFTLDRRMMAITNRAFFIPMIRIHHSLAFRNVLSSLPVPSFFTLSLPSAIASFRHCQSCIEIFVLLLQCIQQLNHLLHEIHHILTVRGSYSSTKWNL